MPIKGLTDRELRFPEIGQIRKGAPKEPGRPGADLKYFRVTFDEQETETAAKFAQVYGNVPAEINIILPFNEIERCWDAWYEAYTAGRMVARSDGEFFTYLLNTETGEQEVVNGTPQVAHREVVGSYVNRNSQKKEIIKCRPVGRLRVIIPELARAAYLTVLTTSIHDIVNISAQLEAFKAVNGGRIAGIPLVLRRRPRKISTPKPDGTRARMSKWLLSIEADPTWVSKMLVVINKSALPGNGLALLSAPEADAEAEHETDETDDVILPGEISDVGEEWDEEIFDEGETPPEPEPVKAVNYEVSEKGWEEWEKLVAKAELAGINVDTVPRSVPLADLRGLYIYLKAIIKEKESI